MTFPVSFTVGAFRLPAHFVFEALGYFIGFRVFLWLRTRWRDAIPETTRFSVIAAAAVGAMAGSRLLAGIQNAPELLARHASAAAWLSGKTIIGGLLGGLLTVEWVKKGMGESRRTGDLFVIPLCVGMSIGRIGCLLAGLEDHTHGNPTTLPWGVDFGDGIRRHPAQLYEIVALALIAVWAVRARRRLPSAGAAVGGQPLLEGDLFRGFLSLYLAFRLALEAIKPEPRLLLGLSALQIACVAGLLYYARDWSRLFAARGAVLARGEGRHG